MASAAASAARAAAIVAFIQETSAGQIPIATVEADLIDRAGDGTEWGYSNATIDGKPVG